MGIHSVGINNIRWLGDVNFDKYDPEIIIQVRLRAWCNIGKRYQQRINDCSMASKKMNMIKKKKDNFDDKK